MGRAQPPEQRWFSLPGYQLVQDEERLILTTEALRVTVHQPLWLEWEYKNEAGVWLPLVKDRKTGAYMLGVKNDASAHYQLREAQDGVYGLGEKAGDLNRSGRRFEMRNLDAMGYNAASTDPLYKHIPFTLTRRNNVSFGVFYDNLSNVWLDLGNELDNYHLPYRRFSAEAGDLDYYLFVGPTSLDVTKNWCA